MHTLDGDATNQGVKDDKGAKAKRARGRPPEGRHPVLVRLSDDERAFADLLGNGVAAQGVRVALNAVKHMGIEAVRALSKIPRPTPTSSLHPLEPAEIDLPLPPIIEAIAFPDLPVVNDGVTTAPKSAGPHRHA